MSLQSVRESYGARAAEYIEAVGRIEHVAAPDLALIECWARGLDGPVLDVGCGPGQWTHLLSDLGVDASGVDPVPEFVERARAAHPAVQYRVAQAENLGMADASLGGVLAWYSLIHTDPSAIGEALTEFARCIRPGGGLALGFFTGAELTPFDHAITTAYFWPVELISREVEAAGFMVTHTEQRTDRPNRAHAALLAVRG